MAEVLFYHLTRTPLEATLPDLLEKSRDRGWKVVVRGGHKERLAWLDEKLWTVSDAGFLPHGMAGGPHDSEQPILLTLGTDAPNGAEIMMAVDGAEVSPDEAGNYTRVCVIFDGSNQTALEQARRQWKTLTDAGLPAKYWSQESGRWEVKATKNV